MSRSNRSLRILSVLLVGGVSTLLAMIVVTLATDREPSSPTSETAEVQSPTRVASNMRSERRRRAPVDPPPALAVPTPEVIDPADVPDSRQLNRKHPGFAKAYADASYAAQARSEARIQRRCQTSLPESVKEIRWETVETFEPSDDGVTLVRKDIQFVPASDELAAFTKCMARATPNDSTFKMTMPEDSPIHDELKVRNAGVIFVNDYTKEEIAQEVATLRQRVADPALTPDQRAALQDHLDLWECYDRLGLNHRRECLSQ